MSDEFKKNGKILFLGFAIPKKNTDALIKSGYGFSIQTHKYSWALINALTVNGFSVSLLSVPQVFDYPKADFYYSKGEFSEGGCNGKFIPFLNITLLKHLTRMFNSFLILCRELNENRFGCLLIYGLHSPFLISSVVAKLLFKLPIFVVVTDPPSLITDRDGKIKRWLKKIDQILIRFILRNFDGGIVLSKFIGETYLKNKPFIVVESIYNSAYSIDLKLKHKQEKSFAFTYAGSLDKESGIENLIQAFSNIERGATLNICGSGSLYMYCYDKAKDSKNIKFWGLLNHNELVNLMSETDIMVNVRNPSDDFTRYSFPSKIVEILGAGLPLLSTRLLSIPNDYESYIYYIDEYTQSGIEKSINEILTLDKQELIDKGARAKMFIRSSKNEMSQGKNISEFIKRIYKHV